MTFPTKQVIRSLGVLPKKNLGQHFLTDKTVADLAARLANIGQDDTVIEIGPGLGSLTHFLSATGASRLVAVELDRALFAYLSSVYADSSSVELLRDDILNISFFDYACVETPCIVIGSIPYSQTAPILLKLFSCAPVIKRSIVLLQKEVAIRLCACPGTKEYGIFSVYAQAYAPATIHCSVSPDSFYPHPKVESALLQMKPLRSKKWLSHDEVLFREVVRSAFSQRRKTVYNALKNFLRQKHVSADDFKEICNAEHFNVNARAETFSADEFYALTHIVASLVKSE